MTTIQLSFSEDMTLVLPEQSTDTLERLAREALIVRLYDLGQLSSGHAARLLGITRWDFLDLLGNYHVSWFDEQADVVAESRYGQ